MRSVDACRYLDTRTICCTRTGNLFPKEKPIIAQVDFRPLVEGLAGKSRTAGDAIKSIQDLCVVVT